MSNSGIPGFNALAGAFEPDYLLVGKGERTANFTVKAGEAFPRGTVIAADLTTGEIEPAMAAGVNGVAVPIGVASYDVEASANVVKTAVYVEATFNPEHIFYDSAWSVVELGLLLLARNMHLSQPTYSKGVN